MSFRARTRDYDGYLVSTDPPYYDNVGYADLSDYFYVWLRRSLGPRAVVGSRNRAHSEDR